MIWAKLSPHFLINDQSTPSLHTAGNYTVIKTGLVFLVQKLQLIRKNKNIEYTNSPSKQFRGFLIMSCE